jgi:hypothetical protein
MLNPLRSFAVRKCSVCVASCSAWLLIVRSLDWDTVEGASPVTIGALVDGRYARVGLLESAAQSGW